VIKKIILIEDTFYGVLDVFIICQKIGQPSHEKFNLSKGMIKLNFMFKIIQLNNLHIAIKELTKWINNGKC
jgi:hypothetical protein